MTILRASLLVLSLSIFGACGMTGDGDDTGTNAASQPTDSMPAGGTADAGPMNDECPVSGEPVDPDVQTVSFEGKAIGFCCGNCMGKFEEMSDAEKSEALASIMK